MAIDLARIEDWLSRRALPFWASNGWDERDGGFFDRIERASGQPVAPDDGADKAKRLRVQARQIYVYSHASLLELDAKGRDRAAAGLAFMTQHYWHDDGGWIFSCDRSGTPLNSDRNLYEQAFALFALAWVHKATGKTEPLDWAARTVDFLDSEKSDKAHGGYWDETPGSLPRCQNPHMYFLEA